MANILHCCRTIFRTPCIIQFFSLQKDIRNEQMNKLMNATVERIKCSYTAYRDAKNGRDWRKFCPESCRTGKFKWTATYSEWPIVIEGGLHTTYLHQILYQKYESYYKKYKV